MLALITIDNDLYGTVEAIARTIDQEELLAEMPYMPPLGSRMTIAIGGVTWAHAEVTGHPISMIPITSGRLVRLRFYGGIDVASADVHAGRAGTIH